MTPVHLDFGRDGRLELSYGGSSRGEVDGEGESLARLCATRFDCDGDHGTGSEAEESNPGRAREVRDSPS